MTENKKKDSKLELALCFIDKDDNVISKRYLNSTYHIAEENSLLKEPWCQEEFSEAFFYQAKISLTINIIKEMFKELSNILNEEENKE